MKSKDLHSRAGRKVILTLGDSVNAGRKIHASTIYRVLMDEGRWFLPRLSPSVDRQCICLFYQNGAGIAGLARVVSVSQVTGADAALLQSLGIGAMRSRLSLGDVRRFDEPVEFKPIVEQLLFVTNKKYWGQALRSAPREIPEQDFDLILAFAAGDSLT